MIRQKYKNEFRKFREKKRMKTEERLATIDSIIADAREINQILEMRSPSKI
jgi:hypothetical protein